MRRLFLLPATVLMLATTIFPAMAASTFDGKWIAEIPPQAVPCNGTSVLNLLVTDGRVMGQVNTPWGNGTFTGKLDEDGTGTVSFGSDNGTIRFANDRFEMNWSNGRCGARKALGDRAPTDEKLKTIVAQRLQSQQIFDSLAARAASGDKSVDYTALRNAYPFTELWDPYGNKTNGPLQQALAAQKGGDCAAALNQVQTVLKYDFTIDGAHSIRSDCLEDSDRAKSRIESAIADGLTYSLTHSGDGDSEKTAYVINTMREESAVLADRHIQIKARQIEIRGSDGHYYDQIQGISVRGGDVRIKTVYFNVDSFVAGRESRRAAVAVAASAIH